MNDSAFIPTQRPIQHTVGLTSTEMYGQKEVINNTPYATMMPQYKALNANPPMKLPNGLFHPQTQ